MLIDDGADRCASDVLFLHLPLNPLWNGRCLYRALGDQDAFKQHANELVSGPFAGISAEELEGQVGFVRDRQVF